MKQQREFVRYVLRNYIAQGVDELDIGKLATVLRSKVWQHSRSAKGAW
jgi:hypothetical protein